MFKLFITGDIGFEFWMDIPGYEGLYQASTYGRVRSFIWGYPFILKPRVYKTGYLNVGLYKDRVPKVWLLHRLIGITFLPNPENKPYIDHKDTNRQNCHVGNLCWVTRKENSLNPLTRRHISETHYGKSHPNGKGIKTYIYSLDRRLIGVYDQIKIASKETGIREATIINALKGRSTPRRFIIRSEPIPSDSGDPQWSAPVS